jgi:hypothetical protein
MGQPGNPGFPSPMGGLQPADPSLFSQMGGMGQPQVSLDRNFPGGQPSFEQLQRMQQDMSQQAQLQQKNALSQIPAFAQMQALQGQLQGRQPTPQELQQLQLYDQQIQSNPGFQQMQGNLQQMGQQFEQRFGGQLQQMQQQRMQQMQPMGAMQATQAPQGLGQGLQALQQAQPFNPQQGMLQGFQQQPPVQPPQQQFNQQPQMPQQQSRASFNDLSAMGMAPPGMQRSTGAPQFGELGIGRFMQDYMQQAPQPQSFTPQRTSSGPSQPIVTRSSGMRGTPNVMRRAQGGITSLLDET